MIRRVVQQRAAGDSAGLIHNYIKTRHAQGNSNADTEAETAQTAQKIAQRRICLSIGPIGPGVVARL